MSADELIDGWVVRAPTTAELESYSAQSGVTIEEALNSLALNVARRYSAGAWPFYECDAVMNHLHTWSLFNRDMVLPEPALSVFVAFDEGEYHHRNDAADIDPEEKYTRPLIAELLARNDAI